MSKMFALVNAVTTEGKPLYLDGKRKGVLHDFDIPRNVLVMRVPDGMTVTQQQKVSQQLKRVIQSPVLIVDSRIEFLVLESLWGQRVRLLRERVAAFWAAVRSKFALFHAKS